MINSYNAVHYTTLDLVSIEMLAILVMGAYVLFLIRKKRLSLEIALFLSFPFSNLMFRIGSMQVAEVLSLALVVANYKQIRLTYVTVLACVFLYYSLLSYADGMQTTAFSLGYAIRFLLTALVFSILSRRKWQMPNEIIQFMVIFTFGVTALQVVLWLAGLPIHGVFFEGLIPRAQGLAQEPDPWCVFIFALFPLILQLKLGKTFLLLNTISLILTFSTLGNVVILAYVIVRAVVRGLPRRIALKKIKLIGAVICLVLSLATLAPTLITGATQTVISYGFDKVRLYVYELSSSSGLDIIEKPQNTYVSDSGRNMDIAQLKKYFPDHWLVGVGSFTAPELASGATVPPTNTYLMFLLEVGVSGTLLVAVLLFLHYCTLFWVDRHEVADLVAFCLTFLLMIAGTRCFAFHELWYDQAATLRLGRLHDRRDDPASTANQAS